MKLQSHLHEVKCVLQGVKVKLSPEWSWSRASCRAWWWPWRWCRPPGWCGRRWGCPAERQRWRRGWRWKRPMAGGSRQPRVYLLCCLSARPGHPWTWNGTHDPAESGRAEKDHQPDVGLLGGAAPAAVALASHVGTNGHAHTPLVQKLVTPVKDALNKSY